MNKPLFTLSVGALLLGLSHGAGADERLSTFGLVFDPAMFDTESRSGSKSVKHSPRLGIELTHALRPRLDVFGSLGGQRVRFDNAGSSAWLDFLDLRLGLRQYLSSREAGLWSPYLDASISDAWLRDPAATLGGNRRYHGWNVALGVGKVLSPNTDVRLALGYTRLLADQRQSSFTDVLATVDVRLVAGTRF